MSRGKYELQDPLPRLRDGAHPYLGSRPAHFVPQKGRFINCFRIGIRSLMRAGIHESREH